MNDERKPEELTEEQSEKIVGGQDPNSTPGGGPGEPTAQDDYGSWGAGAPK